MKSAIINGTAVFQQLAAEWDTLATKGVTDTPFQTFAYQQAWWEHLQPANSTLHTIIVRDDANALQGIGCFYLLDGVVHLNGCIEETDYLDLITTAESAEAAWTAVFQALHDNTFPNWHTLDFCNIPQASPSRTILQPLAEKHSLTYQESINELCPIIELPDSFDAYLETLDSKQRREIRRKLRRANGADVQLHLVGPDENIETAVNDFLNLLQKSTIEKQEWLNEGRTALFHKTAKAAQANGSLQLMFLEVAGKKGAALFNFAYKGRTWVYNSGLDPMAFNKLSLGVVATAKAIELAIGQGITQFDFLRGNESYKYSFGAQDTTIFRQQLTKSSA